MMDNRSNCSMKRPIGNNESGSDLDNWINELSTDNHRNSVVKSGTVDAMMINRNYPSQPNMSAINHGTNFRGSSENKSQSGVAQGIMTVNSLPSNNTTATPSKLGQSSQSCQTQDLSQYHRLQPTQAHQNQPLMWQVFKNKAVQQPQTLSSIDQSNTMLGPQKNQHQMTSNHLRHCSRPVFNTQTWHLQNQQALVQPMHRFQGLVVGDGQRNSQEQQQRNPHNVLEASVKLAVPSDLDTSANWRESALKQISQMKEAYLPELVKMYKNAEQLSNLKINVRASSCHKAKVFLEKIIRFLHITRPEQFPPSREKVLNYIDFVKNYYISYKNKNGGSSQHMEQAYSQGSQLQPNDMKLPFNTQQSLSQTANLEANMIHFNQNFPSRRPQQASMASSLNDTSFQMGIEQRPLNPLLTGSLKAAQPNVLSTTQNLNMSGLLTTTTTTTTTVTNFLSSQHLQPAPTNQKFNSEKPKQKTMSPLGSRLVNQFQSPQFSLQKPVNQYAATSACSPCIRPEKQQSSGLSSLSSAESENPTTPPMPGQIGYQNTMKNQVLDMGAPRTSMDAPQLERKQESQDPHLRLIEAMKSLSSKALSSSLVDICSVEKAINPIPDAKPINAIGPEKQEEADFWLEYENKPERNVRRKISVTSVCRSLPKFSNSDSFDQFVCEESDIDSTVTSMNKRPNIEHKNEVIVDEIKESNSKLLETFLAVEDNTSILGDHEGTIVRCLFRNVCVPEIHNLQGGDSSKMMPDFVIQLLVPVDYPNSSPTVMNSCCNFRSDIGSGEQWGKLFEEAVSRFKRLLRGITLKMSLEDMARNWEACAHTVISEFSHQRGGKSFSSRCGRWVNCMSSSGSN